MQSPLRYPGSKGRKSIRQWISSFIPPDIKEVRECFCGGASLFFSLPVIINRWINDSDPFLMAFYTELRDHPADFISRCRAIPVAQNGEEETHPKKGSKNKKYNKRLKEKFDELVAHRDEDPALAYFFVNRTCWMGRVQWDIPSRLYFSNPGGWNITLTDRLEQASRILQNTQITCGGYEVPMFAPGENVAIYNDPPYYCNSEFAESSQLYYKNFTHQDHTTFAENCKKCNHRLIISYDDCEPIRELFKDFHFHENSWTYCGTSSAKSQNCKGKKKGKELIITNFETQRRNYTFAEKYDER